MNKIKYRFEITYQTEQMIHVSVLLRKLDLQIDEVGLKEVMTFSANDREVSVYKEVIIQAYVSAGCCVLNIEGGKIE